MTYHVSVLLHEAISHLAIKPYGVYVDTTFGGGGHTQAILEADPTVRVIACDWDADALELNGAKITEKFPGRVQLVWGNFAQLQLHLKKIGISSVQGILADFGTSQHQIKEKSGFSFMGETPLDMRMSPAHQKVTAAQLVNELSERELTELIGTYGEDRNARTIAQAIVAARRRRPIRTTKQLAEVVMSVSAYERRGIHPATRLFQALRIVVNHELENIESLLVQTPNLLASGGRLVCISFHSLEDRIVKRFFREHSNEFTVVTKHIVQPTEEEVRHNASAGSAKLRAAERI